MARRYFAGQYNVGLESEDVEQEVTKVEAQDKGAETLETELLEVQDSAAEGEDREEAIGNAEAVAEELEEDLEDVTVAAEAGGLDAVAASILARSVNGKLSSIGMSPVRFPATESFGGTSGRVGATAIAQEAIGEKIADIWKAIVAAIKKAVQWAKDHYNKVFGTYERISKRARALQVRAEGETGVAEAKDFENERVFAALCVNKAVNVDILIGSFRDDRHLTQLANHFESLVSKLKDFDPTAENANISGIASEGASFLESVRKNGALTEKVPASDKDKYVEGLVTVTSKEMPGNKCMLASYTEADEKTTDIEKAVGIRTYRLVPFNAKLDIKGKKLPTLAANKVEELTVAIDAFAQRAIKLRGDNEKIFKALEDMAKVADMLSKEVQDAESTDVAKQGRQMARVFTNLNRIMGGSMQAMNTYDVQLAKSCLDYAELSLKQYKSTNK